ncbi:trafficking protein particle complex subunit 10 isoform X3 [Aethina tumida]|uniref:trafficking protein particle complex subunit 10 isoform X3 n=1 Tax=Aethina tumida TaxID=116153 RepID=UPI00214904AC|nr:trafficking protein particle complex subunit 10 isoform X3 [Aethina tumida]
MNGVNGNGLADRRPIITCAGELEVFSAIEDSLSQTLPQDACEWRRSLGRPVRSVHIGANFAPFSSAALPRGTQWDLIRQPLFHIYWTECTDVDIYKTSIRDDIDNWLKELSSKDISDWLIVVVENYDGKRTNKLLPRTTVLDKIRADFAPKQGDRCISVINPGKLESRSADSWRGLVARIRHLLLVAYAKAVSRLEDHVRQQRERRNEIGWDFMQYFHLQEELAQVLEMLGLNDEALVQYDELDALLSQFVVNGITSESVNWLSDFQRPLDRWCGLKLGPSLLSKNPSILELRAYLFAKQAQMLLLTNKVWEMASRCVPFLHTCTRELSILEVKAPPGAISCWLFLASLEVLQTCDKFNHADEVKEYSLHTACLWEYASQKLRDLGELCGLMPGVEPTSEQLHIVVGLSAGMGDNPGPPNNPSPTDKLKLALRLRDVFNKTYLELAELAMGTYKHIGRLRSARLVGRDVAAFYMLLGESQKAAAFLGDLLRTFEQDGWHELVAQTQVELANSYKKAGDVRKLIRACASVSAGPEIDTLIRWTYFDEMQRGLDSLDKTLIVPFDSIIKVVTVSLRNDDPFVMQDNDICVEVVLDSNFPREVICQKVMLSLELLENKEANKSNEKYCKGRVLSGKDMKPRDPMLQRLKIQKSLDYKQDKQLAAAGIVSKFTELRRKDSAQVVPHSDFVYSLELTKLPFVLTPGVNVIRLSKKANKIGKFCLGQVALHIGKMEMVSPPLTPRLVVEVKEEKPSLQLNKRSSALISGVEQLMNLILTIGSYKIEPKSIIKLTASRGLTFQITPDEPLVSSLEFEVGDREPFSSTRHLLRIIADVLSKDHQVSISVPWSNKPTVVTLNFTAPMVTTWRLHTVRHRKYVQINVTGQCESNLAIEEARLDVGGVCDVDSRNASSSQIITNGTTYSFMWELLITPKADTPTIKAEFSVSYKLDESSDNKIYQYFFDINDYQTLYLLDADVEPTKGSEFCRVGAVCQLHLTIEQSRALPESTSAARSLMYEVLAEPNVWAVCGRTAGVVCFDNSDLEHPQTVILDVMPLTSGYLPLPVVRISKYIPAESGNDKLGKGDTGPRLEPFSPGQVYNASKGKQLHVITPVSDGHSS